MNIISKEMEGIELFKNDFGDRFIIQQTDDYCFYDAIAAYRKNPTFQYVVEIKTYTDKEHPRPFSKFPNYQIDLAKIEHIFQAADEQNRIPILYCVFSDCKIVWNLDRIGLETLRRRARKVRTNKHGYDYGKSKETTLQTYLYKEEAVWTTWIS